MIIFDWQFTDGRLIDSDSCQEFVGTDAAPDELKAMRLSKGMKLRNIKVRVRDGAHAAGRQELHQSAKSPPQIIKLCFNDVVVVIYWHIMCTSQDDAEVEARAVLAGYLEQVHLVLFVDHQLDLSQPAERQNLPQVWH